MRRSFNLLSGLLLLPAATTLADSKADPAPLTTEDEIETIVVFSLSPISGAEGDMAHYPGNAQVFSGRDIRGSQARNLNEYLGASASAVHLSDAASNPFQSDLFYRGYGVSPLLGLPQGLAVYQDGVRINEPFGDTVNWDLIPESAIQRVELIPGTNPVFGQNTLGGALSVHTKTGWDQPGVEAEISGVSFDRVASSLEAGFAGDKAALFAALKAESEDGWRDDSASRLRQLFTRATYGRGDDGLDLIVTAADNRLRGNGAVPIELMEAEGRDAVFTHPDQTSPTLFFANLLGRTRLNAQSTLAGGVYLRKNRIQAFNSDGSELSACQDAANVDALGLPLLCEADAEGEAVIEDGEGRPVTADERNDSAAQNSSSTNQLGSGLNLQWAHDGTLLGRHNQTYVGLSYDQGRTRFRSQTELAQLTEDRGSIGSGVVDGDSVVRLRVLNRSLGVFISDVWQTSERLNLTAAARYNRARIQLIDQGEDDDLDGTHHFSRLNPLLGATYDLRPGLTLFTSASEGSRAPTPVELSCANPHAPCKLPNGFVDDPPLKQVVTRNVEVGLRGHHGRLNWNTALYRGISRDDILFITDGSLTNEGYFSNVGDTRRQGAEIGLDWMLSSGLRLSGSYTYIDAQFRENFLVNTPNHPLRDAQDEPLPATREVSSGDHIPLIPRQLFRASADWQHDRSQIGLEILARSSSRYRGDEANVDDQRIGGFASFNAYASQGFGRHLSVFARISNLFDTDYRSFGVYGEAAEVLGEDYEDAHRFVGPGAPRAIYVGIRLNFAEAP